MCVVCSYESFSLFLQLQEEKQRREKAEKQVQMLPTETEVCVFNLVMSHLPVVSFYLYLYDTNQEKLNHQ